MSVLDEHPALTAAMPDISRSLRRGNPMAVYERLRDVVPRGVAGVALLQLVRSEPEWDAHVADWHPTPTPAIDGIRVLTPFEEAEALTDRQMACLYLVAEGLNDREIAEVLSLALPTVNAHFKGIFRKFGVVNRAHAVGEGFRRGLLY